MIISVYYIIKTVLGAIWHLHVLSGLEILMLIRENQRKKRSKPSILHICIWTVQIIHIKTAIIEKQNNGNTNPSDKERCQAQIHNLQGLSLHII
jgi:hypothetical protein